MQVSANKYLTTQIHRTHIDHSEYRDHERVVFGNDAQTGLSTIIAIHNTGRGPALGGCRMFPYDSLDDALTDALRLSRGMTYKNAMAGLQFGGGKAVIIGDPRRHKTPQLLSSFGRHIDRLDGAYITGEDVGLTAGDMQLIRDETPHVRCPANRSSGTPSPYTALGVYHGIVAALEFAFADRSLAGRTISIQGVGHVGYDLARRLHQGGARLVVSDINRVAVQRAVREFGAEAVDPEKAHLVRGDVFAPCALGAVLNDETIAELEMPIVAGAANNQLADERHGFLMRDRSILYAPDYVINAGGVISLAREDASAGSLLTEISKIETTLSEIFNRAEASRLPTHIVANRMAEQRMVSSPKR